MAPAAVSGPEGEYMAIERKNLRSQVREELLARMRSGAVQPGEGINEVQLAGELGVSRTPLREALIALESEGQITSENGKGFRFVPLSASEFEDLAPVMAALEGLALELSPIERLREIGGRLSELAAEFDQEVVEHALVVTKDDEWHGIMLSACPNLRLLDVIASVRGAFLAAFTRRCNSQCRMSSRVRASVRSLMSSSGRQA